MSTKLLSSALRVERPQALRVERPQPLVVERPTMHVQASGLHCTLSMLVAPPG